MEPHINQMYAEWRRFREELGEDWTTLREMAREYRMHKEQQAALGEETAPEADPAEPSGGPETAPEADPSPAAPKPSSEPAAAPEAAPPEEPTTAPPNTPPEPQ